MGEAGTILSAFKDLPRSLTPGVRRAPPGHAVPLERPARLRDLIWALVLPSMTNVDFPELHDGESPHCRQRGTVAS
jgi:hypothetical protein